MNANPSNQLSLRIIIEDTMLVGSFIEQRLKIEVEKSLHMAAWDWIRSNVRRLDETKHVYIVWDARLVHIRQDLTQQTGCVHERVSSLIVNAFKSLHMATHFCDYVVTQKLQILFHAEIWDSVNTYLIAPTNCATLQRQRPSGLVIKPNSHCLKRWSGRL